jgi:glycosyltransferase involved in cell wall biosynthesis
MIGVVKPLRALHRQGRIVFDVALEAWVGQRRLVAADVVVFCRNTEPRFGGTLETALERHVPIIYELDDDFFVMPPEAPGGQYHRDPARLAQLERYLRAAALVRVYSESLRTRLTALNPRVHRVEALVDWDLIPTAPAMRSSAPLRIVYATSRIADPVAKIFMVDLRRVLDTYRGRVEAWFWGYQPPELAGRTDVHFMDFLQDYDAFYRRFAGFGFDIGLAPLPDDEFYRAKSNNKFREYAASRVAGIYSDMVVYRDCVDDGQTGLLVPDVPYGWFTAMGRLIDDQPLRASIQQAAWAYARERYGVAQAAEAWLTHIDTARSRANETRSPDRLVGQPVDLAGPHPATTPARMTRVVRRVAEVLRGQPAPAALALAERITWHVRSLRSLARLRRELAREGREAGRSATDAPRHSPS